MPDYLVQIITKAADETVKTERLIRAKNEARAIAHVVNDTISVDRASTDDILRVAKAGAEVEIAE
jgi:hypothetical protein